jgi:two-component system nitrogen regulation sensor histidine kinase GlnL
MSALFSSKGPVRAATVTPGGDAMKLLNALPHPVVGVRPDGSIANANPAAEVFFGMSQASLSQQRLANLVTAGSPLLSLVEQVRSRGAAINEYRVELCLAKPKDDRLVDIFVTPLQESDDGVVIMLQERSLSEKISRHLTHRGAGRSVAADETNLRGDRQDRETCRPDERVFRREAARARKNQYSHRARSRQESVAGRIRAPYPLS